MTAGTECVSVAAEKPTTKTRVMYFVYISQYLECVHVSTQPHNV